MDPILEFAIKTGVVAVGAWLWIRDCNAREERIAKENAARETRMAAAIETRDDRILAQAKEQTAAIQKFNASVDQNTAATKSLEAAIQNNGCKFEEGKK